MALTAALCGVLVLCSVMTVWVHQTVIRTDGFVSTVRPIVQRPEVARSISSELTNQLFATVKVESRVKAALPGAAGFLASPLTLAAKEFVQHKVERALRSQRFYPIWTAVLRRTHREVITVLRGQSSVLAVTNGAIVLNLLPFVNEALHEVESTASGLLGRDVTVPRLTSGEVPAQIRSRLSSALGVPLPSDFGRIELARSRSIEVARLSLRLVDLLYWLLPIITLLLVGGALWVSGQRRRTALQILIGAGVALIVERRAVRWVASRIVASLSPNHRSAGGVVVRDVFQGLERLTIWGLGVVLVAIVLLLITGPYPWARVVRQGTARMPRALGDVLGRGPVARPAAPWTANHRFLLQAAGAVLGGLALWVVPGWWLFAVAAILVTCQIVCWRWARALRRSPRLTQAKERCHPQGTLFPNAEATARSIAGGERCRAIVAEALGQPGSPA